MSNKYDIILMIIDRKQEYGYAKGFKIGEALNLLIKLNHIPHPQRILVIVDYLVVNEIIVHTEDFAKFYNNYVLNLPHANDIIKYKSYPVYKQEKKGE